MIEITEELIEKISDSDTYKVAKELGVSARELEYAIANKYAEGTDCYDCKHLASRLKCMTCCRGKKDHYERINEGDTKNGKTKKRA